jgi:hypothetical protein
MARETDGRTDGHANRPMDWTRKLETEEYREISNLADDYHSESV